MRILLVEDDELISKALEKILIEQHYVVDVATNGQAGWEFVEAFAYDLIVLDVVMPKLNGIQFCQQLREKGYHMPILMLTAQSSSSDKVLGLDAGADDYVVKPFEWSELLARIRVLLRRGSPTKPAVLEWLNLRLDPGICEVTCEGRTLHLTPKEYRLLELFLRNPHRVFSRSAILDHLWSSEEAPSEEAVTVHIKDLRQKLKRAGVPTNLIETVYGQGYRLKQPPDWSHSAPAVVQTGEKAIHQRTKAELTIVWENHRGLSRDRLAILEQATVEWLENLLDERQRQNAYEAAHKLSGALGIFGFTDASNLAREVEQIFQPGVVLTRQTALHLSELLAALRHALEQPIVREEIRPEAIATNLTENSANYSEPLNALADLNFASSDRHTLRPLLLIVDDDPAHAEHILHLADDWGIKITLAPDLTRTEQLLTVPFDHANETAQNQQSDVVALNLCLAEATELDLVLLAALTNQTPPIPVLLLTDQTNLVNRIKVSHLAAHVILQKSLSPEQVLDVISHVRAQFQTTIAKVMVVDDEPDLLTAMHTLLEPLGLRLNTLDQPLQFWHTLEEFAPDLLILDVNMPHFSGIELCQVIRKTPEWADLPVLFLTVDVDNCTLNQVFAAGADDCISKAIAEPELVTRIVNRLQQARLHRGLAHISTRL